MHPDTRLIRSMSSTNLNFFTIMLKLKAVERKLMVGQYAGQWRYQLQPELYSTLSDKKVIEEASVRSGVSRGILQAAWEAIGAVIKSWATEGHSVAIPGLGTMRFGVNAMTVPNVNMVASSLIVSRKVIFTPNVDIKNELKQTPVSITCYDRSGNIVKRVTSENSSVEDGSEDENGGTGSTTTKYTVKLSCNTAQGSVNGAGSYDAGAEVTIKAIPLEGYKFSQWSDGVTTQTRKLTMDKNYDLTATFVADAGGGDDGGGGLGA